jgi:4-amino-4-deoxy-L-arabinose transferase-like glycosyltransferase
MQYFWKSSTFFLICLIMIAGLLLRVYRLDDQNIWHDEYHVTYALEAPDLSSFKMAIDLVRPLHSAAATYFLLQYGYTGIVGKNLLLLRLLPVSISMLSIFVLFLLGREVHSRGAGLLAALCLAFSPQQIFYAQEIRAYSLVVLLSLTAGYFLFRALRTGEKKFWIANVLASLLLPYTHLMASLFLVVESLYLLCRLKKTGWRVFLTWNAVLLAGVTPLAIMLIYLPGETDDGTSGGVEAQRIMQHVMAGDLVSRNRELLPEWKTVAPDRAPRIVQRLLWIRPAMDLLLLGLFTASALYLFFHGIRTRLFRKPNGNGRLNEALPFLLLLFFVPGLITAGMEIITGRVTISPPYIIYSAAGLYLAAAAGCMAFRHYYLRLIAATVLTGCFVYQAAIFLPCNIRPQWKKAVEIMHHNAQPEDAVIIAQPVAPSRSICWYLADSTLQFYDEISFQGACNSAAKHLALRENATAWIVFPEYLLYFMFDTNDLQPLYDALREALRVRGMNCEWRKLPGHYNVILFQIWREPGTLPHPSCLAVDPYGAVNEDLLLADLGMDALPPEMQEEALCALRGAVMHWPPPASFGVSWYALQLYRNGHPELAERLAALLPEWRPGFGLGYVAYAYILGLNGKYSEAARARELAVKCNPAIETFFGPVLHAIIEEKDDAAALRKLNSTSLYCDDFLIKLPLEILQDRSAED